MRYIGLVTRAVTNRFAVNYALLVLVSVGVYIPSLWNPLIFDDVPTAIGLSQQYSLWPGSLIRWLSSASFSWTYAAIGPNWPWHRAINLFLHATTVCLLFHFIEQLLAAAATDTQSERADGTRRWLATACTLLFAVHPVGVYAVAYLIERSIILATLFGLLMLTSLLHGLRSQSWMGLAISILFYFFALSSKENAVMLIVAALMLCLLFKSRASALVHPLLVVFLCYSAIAYLFVIDKHRLIGTFYEPLVVDPLSKDVTSFALQTSDHPYSRSLITQATLFFKYLLVWIVPYQGWLAIDLHEPLSPTVLSGRYVLGAILFVGYAVVLLFAWLRSPQKVGPIAFGCMVPWTLFFTEFSTVRAYDTFVLYRSYLWMFGLPVALAFALREVPLKRTLAACAIWLAMLLPITLERIASLSSALRAWDDALRKNSADAPWLDRLYNNRAMLRFQAGDHEGALGDLNRALEVAPKHAVALVNRALIYATMGDIPRALQDIQTSLEARSDYVEAYSLRCRLYLTMERLDSARPDCDEALRLQPRHPVALLNSGIIDARQSRLEEAVRTFERMTQIYPDNGAAHFSLGKALAMKQEQERAKEEFRRACVLGYAPGCAPSTKEFESR